MRCPYRCKEEDFVFQDCANDPGAQPENGDVGVCYHCGGWWTMQDGEAVQYTPTKEETKMAMDHMPGTRERFREFVRLSITRLEP